METVKREKIYMYTSQSTEESIFMGNKLHQRCSMIFFNYLISRTTFWNIWKFQYTLQSISWQYGKSQKNCKVFRNKEYWWNKIEMKNQKLNVHLLKEKGQKDSLSF